MEFEVKQVITQILAFLLMLWILKRYAWKPILGTLDARTQRIQKSFDDIEAQKEEVQKLDLAYKQKLHDIDDERHTIIGEAVKEGRKIAHEIQVEAQRQAKETLVKAHEEASREAEDMKAELKQSVVKLSFDLFEKLARTKISPEDQKKLNDELIKEADLK